jgi:hypothetical protein
MITRFYIVPLLLFEIKSQYACQNDSLNLNINCLYLNRYFLLSMMKNKCVCQWAAIDSKKYLISSMI